MQISMLKLYSWGGKCGKAILWINEYFSKKLRETAFPMLSKSMIYYSFQNVGSNGQSDYV